MTTISTLQTLKKWDSETLNALINKLNTEGIVSDEGDLGLSSNMIEGWGSECDQFLSQRGYQGSELISTAQYFEHYGAIYILYDVGRIEHEDAKRELERLASCV